MGAEFDRDLIDDPELKMTDKEIEVAAEELFETAAYNYGHAGYSGTFAEKENEGVTIHRDKVFDDKELAEVFVMDDLDSDKWGPADVVPVKDEGWFIGGWCSS